VRAVGGDSLHLGIRREAASPLVRSP
jgi:hypothetical protein